MTGQLMKSVVYYLKEKLDMWYMIMMSIYLSNWVWMKQRSMEEKIEAISQLSESREYFTVLVLVSSIQTMQIQQVDLDFSGN